MLLRVCNALKGCHESAPWRQYDSRFWRSPELSSRPSSWYLVRRSISTLLGCLCYVSRLSTRFYDIIKQVVINKLSYSHGYKLYLIFSFNICVTDHEIIRLKLSFLLFRKCLTTGYSSFYYYTFIYTCLIRDNNKLLNTKLGNNRCKTNVELDTFSVMSPQLLM